MLREIKKGFCCGDCPSLNEITLKCELRGIQLNETDKSMWREYQLCRETIKFILVKEGG